MHWYKRDPDAALAGMLGLTPEERGIYNTLIDLLYARDGDVPNDDRYMARVQQCAPQMWRRIRDSLIAKGKVRITAEGKLTANRVETTLKEAENYQKTQSFLAKKRWKTTTEPMPSPDASTSTSTSKTLSSSLTTSERERIQPSAELLAHEAKRRPTPGSLATALLDGALARPAYAAASTTRAPPVSSRPFSRAEVGKPNGWDWDEAPKVAAG